MTVTAVTNAQADAGLWNTSGGIWAGNITYSVPGSGALWASGYGAGEPSNGQYGTLDATQAENFFAVMELWDSYIAPSMTQVSDGTPGQIRIAFTDVNVRYPNADAYAYGPSTGGESPQAGDIWVDESEKSTTFARNTQGFELLLHEAGHALGLKHPFESPALPAGYDSTIYSVMSYTHPDWFYTWSGDSNSFSVRATPTIAFTPMVLDIQAMQGRYGADAGTNAGDTTYVYNDLSLNGRQAIYDAGGTDTIDLSALSRGSNVDLRPGAYSDLAFYDVEDQIDDLAARYGNRDFIAQVMKNPNQPAYEWTKNLGIAFSTQIENAIGTESADNIIGNAASNALDGRGGNDTLIGGAGNDRMAGGAGNDTYNVDTAGDTVAEAAGGGIDTVYASKSWTMAAGQEIEILRAYYAASAASGITLTGNAGKNSIYGGAAADRLVGGAGDDTMAGREGDDAYSVDAAGDTVAEAAGGGTDTVYASVGWTMGARQEIEVLRANYASGATTGIKLTGNAGSNSIFGGAAADTLVGGAGNDAMTGRAGNDIYNVDATGDTVTEAAGGGTDTVYASQNWTMGAGQEIEILRAFYAANATSGLALTGNAGKNSIYGGAAADTFKGGAGDDRFFFTAPLNASTNVDTITDFANVSGNDDQFRLDNAVFAALTAVGTLAKALFQFNTTGLATQIDDRIIFETDTGKLFYDADGSKANGVAGVQFALITNYASLTGTSMLSEQDFYVV